MVAVLAVAAFGLIGPPARAQLPTLPPLITTTTTAPGGTTTTSSTLLPNLLPEEVLTPAPSTPEGAPPSSILPLPTPPPTRKTTTFKPPPVPPSTPAKALPAAAKTPRPTAPSNQSTDDSEAIEDDSGFDAELPFNQQDAEFLTAEDTMELGIEEAERDQVRPMASVAAAMLVFVLLGMALWIRAEVHRVPVYTGRGRHFRSGKRQLTEDGEFYWDR